MKEATSGSLSAKQQVAQEEGRRWHQEEQEGSGGSRFGVIKLTLHIPESYQVVRS